MLDRSTRQARHQGGRLAIEFRQVSVREVGDRRRARNAVPREVRHQPEIERQLLRRQALEQGQDIAPLGGGDEVIGILDSSRNRLQRDRCADRVRRQPGSELAFRDGREDRHGPLTDTLARLPGGAASEGFSS
jgi:hypothetical protein